MKNNNITIQSLDILEDDDWDALIAEAEKDLSKDWDTKFEFEKRVYPNGVGEDLAENEQSSVHTCTQSKTPLTSSAQGGELWYYCTSCGKDMEKFSTNKKEEPKPSGGWSL